MNVQVRTSGTLGGKKRRVAPKIEAPGVQKASHMACPQLKRIMGKSAFVLLKQGVYLWLLKSLILHSAASRSWRFNVDHADIHLTECGLDYISRTRMESRVLKATAGVEFQCQISRGRI